MAEPEDYKELENRWLTATHTVGSPELDALLAILDALAGAEVETMVAYCDYTDETALTLTNDLQVVTVWSANTIPVGITESNGEFTFEYEGVYSIFLERIYENFDQNPSDQVNVTIEMQTDDQQGSGFVSIFNRTAPISSATSAKEPAILPFGTALIKAATAGTVFRVLVSAEDDGSAPQDTQLIRMKLTANLIHPLPTT